MLVVFPPPPVNEIISPVFTPIALVRVNRFVYDLNSGKKIYDEILDAAANGYVPDSFFIYKELLFILKEKSVLIVCEIIN